MRSIRTAEGAIEFPTPEEARRFAWTDADRALVQDRVDTQFVGTPAQVADQLELLRDATGADELVLTTITHDHADRVRSYDLIAAEWARRGSSTFHGSTSSRWFRGSALARLAPQPPMTVSRGGAA